MVWLVIFICFIYWIWVFIYRFGFFFCDVKKFSIKYGDVIFDEVVVLGVEVVFFVGVWVMICFGGEVVFGNFGLVVFFVIEYMVEFFGCGYIFW